MKESKLYQLHDAQMDMLKGLNVLTDCGCPTFQQVQMMSMLAEGVKDLQEAINMETALNHPDVAAVMAEHKK